MSQNPRRSLRVCSPLVCLLIAAATLAGRHCHAGVISAMPLDRFNVQVIPPPPSTTLDSLTGPTFVFEEVNHLVLGSDLQVDVADPGIPGSYFSGGSYSPGVIPAGTRVSSVLVHFDFPGVPVFAETRELIVHLDEDIIGVILTDELLDASDPIVGSAATLYPTGLDQRGTTSDIGGGDTVTVGFPLDIVSRDVIIETTVDVVLDQVRIITLSPIPEPTTASMAALVAASLVACHPRRRSYASPDAKLTLPCRRPVQRSREDSAA